ncbi:Copia protein [Gossypium australe]|uniref:Copia protein n=1 Tax=Gossypium australe TaxID=47621 RepID=A0A5B6WPT2_9ROSI|nr:Copia protein [Gossypium australe]
MPFLSGDLAEDVYMKQPFGFEHVGLDLYFVRDKVLGGQLQVNYVLTQDQVADVLIKPLTKRSFSRCRDNREN